MARPSSASAIVSACLAGVLCTGVATRVAAHSQTLAVRLTDLLTRAGAYVADYKQTFAAIVSEELYTQQIWHFASCVFRSPWIESGCWPGEPPDSRESARWSTTSPGRTARNAMAATRAAVVWLGRFRSRFAEVGS
jgi:hypothetical protein